MRTQSLAVVLVASMLAGGQSARAGDAAAAGAATAEGPFVGGNLAVYLIRDGRRPAAGHPYLTLKDGLAGGTVVVHEVAEVNQLEVENRSDGDVFLQAGEIVKGGQQDRTLARDLIVSAHSGRVPIDAHCVEHGRWSQRGTEAVAQFNSSDDTLASKELRRANYAADQQGVWDNVARARQQLAANVPAAEPTTQPAAVATADRPAPGGGGGGRQSLFSNSDSAERVGGSASTSLQMAMEDKGVRAALAATLKRLPPLPAADADVVGYAFAVNGKLDGGDVYASHALFARLFPKLLNAAAVEAVIDQPAGRGSGDVPPPPSAGRVTAAIAAVDAAAAEPIEVNGRVRPLVNREGQAADVDGGVAANSRDAAVAMAVPAAPAAGGRAATVTPPPAAATVDRAKVFSRATADVDEYETRDTAVPAEPFVHRTYLTK